MELHAHSLNALFDQLGLDDTDEAIERFVNNNAPLPDNLELHEADLWNSSQASFLKQAKEEDADWAEIVDQLNVMLRKARA